MVGNPQEALQGTAVLLPLTALRGEKAREKGDARPPQKRFSARRTEKPLHPTNLHVNQALFPRDTVQSRLPDPEWLERWLDEQIRFDDGWEKKVVERILHNLSILFERTFSTAQELNRYRKEVVQRLQAEQGTQQPA